MCHRLYNGVCLHRKVLKEVIPYEATHKSLIFIEQKFLAKHISSSEAEQMFFVSLQMVKADQIAMVIAKASLPSNLCCFFWL